MTTWADLPLSEGHVRVLEESAITPATAARIGVRTAATAADLPDDLAYLGDKPDVFPALLFPWREPDGTLRTQIKPATPVVNGEGKLAKYLFGKGNHAQLTEVLADPDATRVLIVEGSKQSLAAASYAPARTAVYGVLGCRGWSKDGVPTPHLSVVEDREVYICLDADAATNLDVYTAAVALADACRFQGATRVAFVRLPAGKKAGLDDVLGAQAPDRRAGMVLRLLEQAAKKPADAKPKPKKAAREGGGTGEESGDRPMVAVNGDRHLVVNDLTKALAARWDGIRLFNFGGALSRVEGHEVTPLERGEFLDTLAGTVRMVNMSESAEGEVKTSAAWPDANTIQAVASRGRLFTPLKQVARAPFVRKDGTVVTDNGYDPVSQVLLAMPEDLEVSVADDPSPEGVAAAVKFLLDDWLADFPFPTDADRANVLALILTPLVRDMMSLVPVAVVNGLQMGVGKNKLANAISLVTIGELATPLGYNRDEEEQRKVMTSVFRTGQSFMVWDECHHLEGAHLARAITSPTYTDRVLGGSVLVAFPNRATWMTLGNGVRVEGDMVRRVYQIRMKTDLPNPQDRPESAFRHPDIEGWTRDNRGLILSALLTLVRAWHAAGRPGPEGGASFGSFEEWEKVVGGILRHAGVPGFLGNMREFRSDSDYSVALWEAHLSGLADHFGDREFTTRDVKTWLDRHADTAEAPPGLTDTTGTGFTRDLGMAYQKQRDRWYGGYRLVRSEGTGHGKVAKWSVARVEQVEGAKPVPPVVPPAKPASDQRVEGPEGLRGPSPSSHAKNTSVPACSDDVITEAPIHVFPMYGGGALPPVPPNPPKIIPRQRDGEQARPVNPFMDYTDPLDAVLATAYQPTPEELACPECSTPKQPVPPSGIGYACPRCQASMFPVSS